MRRKVLRLRDPNEGKFTVRYQGKRTKVGSEGELQELINQLAAQAVQDGPFSIQVEVNRKTCLLLTLGREESHMGFYSETQSPLGVGCRGPWDSSELIEFDHGGEPSSIEKRYCVPMADAWEALQHYIRTGTRPENIRWSNDM